MSLARETLLLLISTPIYAVVIGGEMLFSGYFKKGLYSTRGVLSNIYLTALNLGLDLLVLGLCVGILNFFFQFRVADLSATPVLYWTVLIILEDFMYYWLHRVDHFCRFFWAVHVTHHSSHEFNLTVGFRSSVFQPLYRFIYFIPLALLGFSAIDIMFAYSATQIFGILVHTQAVKKLGVLEYILVTPSHHRVHHASNVKYLDRNMGMLLIIWDKLFGTFEAEDENEPVQYGLTSGHSVVNPVNMVFHEWKSIFSDVAKKELPLRTRLMYVFGPPGWSHDGSRLTSSQLRAQQEENETAECIPAPLKG